jgi:cytochrome oxidase Cu insertion factor (SCO1/SenC/PrrC family)
MHPTISPPASSANETTTRGWNRWVLGGIGFAVLAALALGALMIVLLRSDRQDDPDAQTPIIAPDYPRHLVDFSLLNQAGQVVKRQDLAGKIVVVDFLFTSCSVTCPFVNAQMEQVAHATAARPDVYLLSLTLDPADDTVAVLSNYAASYGANPARWGFLTGNQAVMHNLVATSFLPPDTTGQFSYMPGNFAHVQRIVLIDKSGRIVSYFDGLNQNAGDAVLAQINKLDSAR